MRRFAVLLALATLGVAAAQRVGAQSVEVSEIRRDFTRCRAMADVGQRVACYDAMVVKLEPPRFHGSLSDETPPFKTDGPTLLRYQSDGPIFVMYLKDENGNVLQNLHIGGGGESSYRIEKAGTYILQISGTDTWRVWVVPEVTHPPPHG